MIRTALKEDYVSNPDLLAAVKKLYADPTFLMVMDTMHKYTRSYLVAVRGTDAGALGYKAGFSDGQQFVLDQILSLDVLTKKSEIQSDFAAEPTE